MTIIVENFRFMVEFGGFGMNLVRYMIVVVLNYLLAYYRAKAKGFFFNIKY